MPTSHLLLKDDVHCGLGFAFELNCYSEKGDPCTRRDLLLVVKCNTKGVCGSSSQPRE
jgi:hypothetical protein